MVIDKKKRGALIRGRVLIRDFTVLENLKRRGRLLEGDYGKSERYEWISLIIKGDKKWLSFEIFKSIFFFFDLDVTDCYTGLYSLKGSVHVDGSFICCITLEKP